MGVRYEKQFETKYGNTQTVQVLDDQYSGSSKEIELNREEPYKLNQPESGYEDLHLRTTFCELNIKKSPENIYDLIRSESKGRFKIRIKKNGSLYYEGEVEPTLAQKNEDFGPAEYKIQASDLSKLKRVSPFYGSSGPPTVGQPNNKISALDVILDCLQELNINRVSTVVSLIHQQGNASNNPLSEYGFWYSFKEKDGTYKAYSCFEVLKQVAKRFNLTITWTPGGEYFVEEWTDKDDETKTKYTYDPQTQGLISSGTYSQSVQVDDNDVQIKPSLSHQTEKRAKSVSSKTRHRVESTFFQNSFVENPEFGTFGGWVSLDDSNYDNAEFGYALERDAVKIENSVAIPGDYIGPEDTAVKLRNKQQVTKATNAITVESVWMQKGSADEYEPNQDRNVWKSNTSETDGWNYNGDPQAHAFSVQFDSGVKLVLMEYTMGGEVREEGEQEVPLSPPSVISPNPISDPVYGQGVTILPKGHTLTFPWATVKLLEDYKKGDFSTKVEVESRSFVDDEKNAWGINDQGNSQPLIPSGEKAYAGGWVETTYDEYLAFPAVDNGGDRTSFSSKLPSVKPNGEPISSKMQIRIRGNVMTTPNFVFKMDVRPSSQVTEYTAKEPSDSLPAEFVEGKEDPNKLDRGEFFIGTTPRQTRGSVIDMSSGNMAINWGDGLLLEERTLTDILYRANVAPDRLKAEVRTENFGPHKVLKLDGEIYIPTQLNLTPVEGRYKGSFRKITGLDLDWDYETNEEETDEAGEDEETGTSGPTTIVKPEMGAESIAEYLASEKENLTLAADLIEFNGASEFSEYLVSDDYDGDLPIEDSANGTVGEIQDNGTKGFIIKDAYVNDEGTVTSDSEMVITNATIRDTLIEDGVDLGSGTFTGLELELNSNLDSNTAPSSDARIRLNRGSSTDALIEWDETNDEWVGGLSGSLEPIVGENFQLGPQLEYDDVNFDPKRLEILQGEGNGLNADSVDGFEPGGTTGDIPINNSNLMNDLNADKLDGKDADTIINQAGVDVDLNADGTEDITPANLITIFNDTNFVFSQGDTNELEINVGAQWPDADQLDGFDASNNSGDVPISNGTVNQNLNSDQLDGYEGSEVAIRAENETISGEYTHTSRLILDGTTLRTKGASTGFTGSGAIIDDQESWFEDLQVRGSLIAREFELRKITVTKGDRVFGPGGGKIEEVSGNGPYTLTFSEPTGVQPSDICLIQESDLGNGDRTLIKSLELNVNSTSNQTKTVEVSVNSGTGAPEKGDDLVVVGSSDTSRDSLVFLSPYGPYIDTLSGINNFSDWNNRQPNVRFGKIGGMPSIAGESPSGFGLWGDNVYLQGTIRVTEGEITDTVTIGGNQAQDLETITGAQDKADSAESDAKNFADNLDSSLRNDLQTTFENAVANGNTVIDGGVIATNLVTLDSVAFVPVEENQVIGSINASSEGIEINAQNLEIGANTTFTTAEYDPSNKTPKEDGGVVIRSNTEPSSRPSGDDLEEGDTWIDTDDGDKPYTYTGFSFTPAYTLINGGNIRTGTITSTEINTGSIGVGEFNDDGTYAVPSDIPETSVTIRDDFEPFQRPDGSSLEEGDVWIDTDDGDKPHTYDGFDWVQAYTSIDGGFIKTGKVAADRIATGQIAVGDLSDGSDYAKLSEAQSKVDSLEDTIYGQTSDEGTTLIDGGKIVTNLIAADEIAVGDLSDGGNYATLTQAQNKADDAESSAESYADGLDQSVRSDLETTFENAVKNGNTIIDGGVIATDLVTTDSLAFTPTDSSNIVGTINASSEGININANKLKINSNTTFANNYDPSNKAELSDIPDSSVTIRSNSKPSSRPDGSSLEDGDIWIETDEGNRPYVYDNSNNKWERQYTAINGGNIITSTIQADSLSVIETNLGSVNINENINMEADGSILVGSGVDRFLVGDFDIDFANNQKNGSIDMNGTNASAEAFFAGDSETNTGSADDYIGSIGGYLVEVNAGYEFSYSDNGGNQFDRDFTTSHSIKLTIKFKDGNNVLKTVDKNVVPTNAIANETGTETISGTAPGGTNTIELEAECSAQLGSEEGFYTNISAEVQDSFVDVTAEGSKDFVGGQGLKYTDQGNDILRLDATDMSHDSDPDSYQNEARIKTRGGMIVVEDDSGTEQIRIHPQGYIDFRAQGGSFGNINGSDFPEPPSPWVRMGAESNNKKLARKSWDGGANDF